MTDQRCKPPVTIIGAGVMGLTCGVVLQRADYPVTIFTKHPLDKLVSSKAGAVWFPYHAEPAALVGPLALDTYRSFARLAQEQPECGVSMVTLTMLARATKFATFPEWLTDEHAFHRCASGELPSGVQDGYTLRVPFIDPTCYLPYLREVFARQGGVILSREVSHFSTLQTPENVVVNCTGLGARQVADDPEVYPVRGQTVRTTKLPEAVCMVDGSDEKHLAYVFSRAGDCLLGGTAEADEWDETVSKATQEAILQRCRALDPRLEQVTILGSAVGLRPCRHEVRLELGMEEGTGNLVIHNYGHGGSGFTLSWGCAAQVLRLVQQGVQVREALQTGAGQ